MLEREEPQSSLLPPLSVSLMYHNRPLLLSSPPLHLCLSFSHDPLAYLVDLGVIVRRMEKFLK